MLFFADSTADYYNIFLIYFSDTILTPKGSSKTGNKENCRCAFRTGCIYTSDKVNFARTKKMEEVLNKSVCSGVWMCTGVMGKSVGWGGSGSLAETAFRLASGTREARTGTLRNF